MNEERFEVKNAANAVEIAASRFKMPQIVRKMQIVRTMDRAGHKKYLNEKKRKNKTIPDPLHNVDYSWIAIQYLQHDGTCFDML